MPSAASVTDLSLAQFEQAIAAAPNGLTSNVKYEVTLEKLAREVSTIDEIAGSARIEMTLTLRPRQQYD
jgi:hypothetical protein